MLRTRSGEAWQRRGGADTGFAMKGAAKAGRGPAGGGIANPWGFCSLGKLPRVVGCNALQFRFAQTGEHEPHQVVPALAGDVRPHRLRQVFRVLSDEVWNSGPFGDAAFAVARGAPDGLDMCRARAVAVLAIEFRRLGLADPPHQRPAERLRLDRMTVQTGLRTHSMRVGNGWIPSWRRWDRPARVCLARWR